MANERQLRVRELVLSDIELICNYWLNADNDYLVGMGVDVKKLPSREDLTHMLTQQIQLPYEEKSSLALIAEVNGIPSGHCNVNSIFYGKEATMHLHLWNKSNRLKGLGTQMVVQSLPVFFEKLKLETLWCEPYAGNPAPNKTLKKIGFEWVKNYVTTPGALNFEQEVNRYKLTKDRLKKLNIE